MSSKPHQVAAQLELSVHLSIGVVCYLISRFCCSRVLALDQISLWVLTHFYMAGVWSWSFAGASSVFPSVSRKAVQRGVE